MSLARFYPGEHAKEQKFFGSFFQKRTACLPSGPVRFPVERTWYGVLTLIIEWARLRAALSVVAIDIGSSRANLASRNAVR
jgi:hypothetical protein